jgi:hypothetical protein
MARIVHGQQHVGGTLFYSVRVLWTERDLSLLQTGYEVWMAEM